MYNIFVFYKMYVGLFKTYPKFLLYLEISYSSIFKNLCYQKLQTVMCPMSLNLKPNPSNVYCFFQNEYNFPYGRMLLFLRKLCLGKHIQNFNTSTEP